VNRRPTSGLLGAALLLLVSVAGCAAPGRFYLNGEADMAFYKKVAVLPFANLTPDHFAGERVTRMFVTELVIADRFQIADPGEVRAVLERTGGLPTFEGTYDPKKLKDAAVEVGANGLIRGAVSEYQMTGSTSGSQRPSVAFDVEMVDVATGNVVWKASISKRGKTRIPILGGGTATLSRLTEDACREVVHRIDREAF
jgi:curli biogenesis system outer membrane secretion channel CsgG